MNEPNKSQSIIKKKGKPPVHFKLFHFEGSPDSPESITLNSGIEKIFKTYQRDHLIQQPKRPHIVLSIIGPNNVGKSTFLNDVFKTPFICSTKHNDFKQTTYDINCTIQPHPPKKCKNSLIILDSQGFDGNGDGSLDFEQLRKRDGDISRAIYCVSQIIIVYYRGSNGTTAFQRICDILSDAREKQRIRAVKQDDQKPHLCFVFQLRDELKMGDNNKYEKTLSELQTQFERHRALFCRDFAGIEIMCVPLKKKKNMEFEKKKLNDLLQDVKRELSKATLKFQTLNDDVTCIKNSKEYALLTNEIQTLHEKYEKNIMKICEMKIDESFNIQDLWITINAWTDDVATKFVRLLFSLRNEIEKNETLTAEKELLQKIEKKVKWYLTIINENIGNITRHRKRYEEFVHKTNEFYEMKIAELRNRFLEIAERKKGQSLSNWISAFSVIPELFSTDSYLQTKVEMIYHDPRVPLSMKKEFHNLLKEYNKKLTQIKWKNWDRFKSRTILKCFGGEKKIKKLLFKNVEKTAENKIIFKIVFKQLLKQGKILFETISQWYIDVKTAVSSRNLRSLILLFQYSSIVPINCSIAQLVNHEPLIHYCIRKRFGKGIKYLLTRKAFNSNYNVLKVKVGQDNHSALSYILYDVKLVECLVLMIKCLKMCNEWNNYKEKNELLFHCFKRDIRNNKGKLIKHQNTEAFNILIQNGCEINAIETNTGDNVLHMAVRESSCGLCFAVENFISSFDFLSQKTFRPKKSKFRKSKLKKSFEIELWKMKNKEGETPVELCEKEMKKMGKTHSLYEEMINIKNFLRNQYCLFNLFENIIRKSFKRDEDKRFEIHKFKKSPIPYLEIKLRETIQYNSNPLYKYFRCEIKRIKDTRDKSIICCLTSCEKITDYKFISTNDKFNRKMIEEMRKVKHIKRIGGESYNRPVIFFYDTFVAKKLLLNINGENNNEIKILQKISNHINVNHDHRNNEKKLIKYYGYIQTDFSLIILFSKYTFDLHSYRIKLNNEMQIIRKEIHKKIQIENDNYEIQMGKYDKEIEEFQDLYIKDSKDLKDLNDLNDLNDSKERLYEEINKRKKLLNEKRDVIINEYILLLTFMEDTFNIEISRALYLLSLSLYDLHSLKIIHDDIKPRNILINKINSHVINLAITDMGTAKLHKEYKSIMIDVNVSSPNVANALIGKSHINFHEKYKAYFNDIFAMGGTVLYMLCGEEISMYTYEKDMHQNYKIKYGIWNYNKVRKLIESIPLLKQCKIMTQMILSSFKVLNINMKRDDRIYITSLCTKISRNFYIDQLKKYINKYDTFGKVRSFKRSFSSLRILNHMDVLISPNSYNHYKEDYNIEIIKEKNQNQMENKKLENIIKKKKEEATSKFLLMKKK